MSKTTNQGINYKGSLLERADKEGWKVTVLKPQGVNSEQFIRDKFRDDRPDLFEVPDKKDVFRGGGINTERDGGFSWDNVGGGEKTEKEVYDKLDFQIFISKLGEREQKIAKMFVDGYNWSEIKKVYKCSQFTIKKVLEKYKKIING